MIDDGLGRTVLDVMRLFNENLGGLSNLHVSVAKRMIEGLTNISNASGFTTRQERSAFIKKHWKAIDFAVSQFPVSKRVTGITQAGSLAAIGRAFYHESQAKLEHFADVLALGMSTDPADFAIIRLRNYLITRKQSAGGRAGTDAYAKTEKAIKMFCNGEKVGSRVRGTDEELYPLPSDKK